MRTNSSLPLAERDVVERVRRQWAAEFPRLDTAPLEVTHRVTSLASRFNREALEVVVEFGISGATFDLLAALYAAGPAHRLTPSQLSAGRMVSSGAVTARLDAAEKDGLIERHRTPDDRRAVPVVLTGRGLKVVGSAAARLVARHADWKARLTGSEQAALLRCLRMLATIPAEQLVRTWVGAFGRADGWTVGLLGLVPLVSKRIDQASREVVEPLGLTPNGFGLLCALRRAGPPFQLAPTHLYEVVVLSPAGVTGQLDKLVAAGFVKRSREPTDHRIWRAGLTLRGKQCVERSIRPFIESHRQLLSHLSEDDREMTAELLRRLAA